MRACVRGSVFVAGAATLRCCGSYPHTTTHPSLRPHAIACLWFVNIFWLVAPLLSAVWAFHELTEQPAVSGNSKRQAQKQKKAK